MESCVFCKIINEEIPCHKIYEDEETLAFLDINPASKGHTLIIPKKHYVNIHDVDEETLNSIMKTTKKMSAKLKQKLNASGINIVNASGKDAQQSVFHIHFHAVPRYEGDGLDLWFHGRKSDAPDFDELKKIILG